MPAFQDLTGMHFGRLTVMYRAQDYIQPSGQHKRMWHCKCECGNECDIRASDLKSGNTTSCGCQSSKKRSIGFKDLTGQEFGDYIVLSRAPNHITPKGQSTRMWHCKCIHCGALKDIAGTQLKQSKNICVCTRKNRRKPNTREKKSSSLNNFHKKGPLKTLAARFPQLVDEWDAKRNKVEAKDAIITFISKYYWWLTPYDDILTGKHFIFPWKASIIQRTRGRKCPIITDHAVYSGFNDLATRFPQLLKEWDYDKNTIEPSKILWKSSKKVWWKCPLNHSYEAKIGNRTNVKRPSRCPYCSYPPRKILVGFNDLQTTNPEILAEWDYTKNIVKPTEVSKGYSKKIWWKCKKNHSFQQSIPYKIKALEKGRKETCPYCSNEKLLTGFNDLATKYPWLLAEWDYTKNDVKPDKIMPGSHIKIWWKCPFGHSYKSFPYNRWGHIHSGCPICDKENHTSFPEQAIYFYIKKAYPDAINSEEQQVGMELDIYIPSIRTGIEYDGRKWHSNSKREIKKNKLCQTNNIKLIRIRESGLSTYNNCMNIIRDDNNSAESLNNCIQQLFKVLKTNKNIKVNTDRDAVKIYQNYIKSRKENNLAKKYPEIATEWNYKKNGDLKPEMLSYGTPKEVWWIGPCGHEYKMSVYNRTKLNCGCPYCANKRVLHGFNDLTSWCKLNKREDLLEEWNSRNNISPIEVGPHSDKKVWWHCKKCGNEWKAKIDSRTRMNAGCPECAHHKISASKCKTVINLDTGKKYTSLLAAEEDTGINRNCISAVCLGKMITAGGYHWEYL